MPKRNLRVDRSSIRQLEKNLLAIYAELREELTSFLEGQSESIIEEANANHVPVWTGALKFSSWTEQAEESEEQLRVTFGYADPETPIINPETGVPVMHYAIEVHEHGSPLYPYPHKYLETPVNEHAKKFEQELQKVVTEALSLAARRVGG